MPTENKNPDKKQSDYLENALLSLFFFAVFSLLPIYCWVNHIPGGFSFDLSVFFTIVSGFFFFVYGLAFFNQKDSMKDDGDQDCVESKLEEQSKKYLK